MASDAQQSGPLPGEKFTVSRWVQIFGADSGIVGDTNGSAFGLTLSPSSDTVEVGSPTLESIAVVGGFPLIIPEGLTQSLEVPPSTNASVGRTDLITARLDTAAYTVAPGPVRLHRFTGTEGSTSLPSYDATPPSPDTLPLWAITRKMGESLNQAIVRDLRAWTGPAFVVAPGAPLPQSSPLGSHATRAGAMYRRDMVGSAADWVREWSPVNASGATVFDTGWVTLTPLQGWEHVPGRTAAVRRVGTKVGFRGAFQPASGNPAVGDHTPALVPPGIGCQPTAMSRWSSMTFSDGTTVRTVLSAANGALTFYGLPGDGAALPVENFGFTTD